MHNLEGWGLQKHYNNYPPPPLMYAVDKVRIDTLTMKKYNTHKMEIYLMVLQFTRHKVQSFDASFSLFSISCIVFRTISPENLGCSEKDTKCHSLWQHIETETGTNCSTIFWKLKEMQDSVVFVIIQICQITFCVKFLAWMETVWCKV